MGVMPRQWSLIGADKTRTADFEPKLHSVMHRLRSRCLAQNLYPCASGPTHRNRGRKAAENGLKI
jgi:hypothetical protein